MVALGSVQRLSTTIKDSRITYDHYADYGIDRMGTRPGVTNIMEIYNHGGFSWSPSYIQERFVLARKYAAKVKYLVFLMEEEIVQPSASEWYGTWGGSNLRNHAGYTGSGSTVVVDPPTGASVNWGASSEEFYLQMLKAWITMVKSLPTNNEACLVMDGQSDPNSFLPYVLGESGCDYIAKNFGMVWIYGFPTSAGEAACGKMDNGQNFPCARDKINFWRGKGFKGLIFHLITPGYGSDAAVVADFKNGADNGADIEGCYQYKSITANDNLATARMLAIAAQYVPPAGTKHYKCSGAPNYQCTEDPAGQYTSLAACQAACTSNPPPPPTQKYKCSGSPNFTCALALDGVYDTLAQCQSACQQAPPPGTATFYISTVPIQGARVLIDNVEIGITPIIKTITPGSHALTLKFLGYNDVNDTVTLTSGQNFAKTYTLVSTSKAGDVGILLVVLYAAYALGG